MDVGYPPDLPIIFFFLFPESFISEVEEEQMLGEGPQWEELPNELWQLIFQQVPLLDLVTSGRRVCQRWNQIIADEQVHLRELILIYRITGKINFDGIFF